MALNVMFWSRALELLLLLIPVYLFISLVAFYKWLRLSVEVSSLQLELSRSKKEVGKLKDALAGSEQELRSIRDAQEPLKAQNS